MYLRMIQKVGSILLILIIYSCSSSSKKTTRARQGAKEPESEKSQTPKPDSQKQEKPDKTQQNSGENKPKPEEPAKPEATPKPEEPAKPEATPKPEEQAKPKPEPSVPPKAEPKENCQKSQLGIIRNPALNEISGIDASKKFKDTYWVHNDSGDRPNIFQIDAKGKQLKTIPISNANAIDWEDIGIGPCNESESCIFVADFGNNHASRNIFDLYMIPEGESKATKFQFRYPASEAFNAEAFMVNPQNGDKYVVRKTGSAENTLFKFPSDMKESEIATLETICSFSQIGNQKITAGDIHISGKRMLLRTYSHIYEFKAETLNSPDLCTTQVRSILHGEAQGEAIAYLEGRYSFVTVSEKVGQPFYLFECD